MRGKTGAQTGAGLVLVLLMLAASAVPAWAHHGYEWLSPEPFELTGVVEEIYLGNPHGYLHVDTPDGEWTIELSDPGGHESVGFGPDSVRIGDRVTARGYQARDPQAHTMRGDVLEIGERRYVIFPPNVFALPSDPSPLARALAAVRDWSVAEALRNSLYAYPLVNTLHILGIVLLVGSILPLDARILGAFGWLRPGELARVLVPFSVTGLLLAVVAGGLLFTVKPQVYAGNPAFLAKLVLVGLGVLNALCLHVLPAWRVAAAGGRIAPGLKAMAAASMAIWIAAIFAGRWIAFLD